MSSDEEKCYNCNDNDIDFNCNKCGTCLCGECITSVVLCGESNVNLCGSCMNMVETCDVCREMKYIDSVFFDCICSFCNLSKIMTTDLHTSCCEFCTKYTIPGIQNELCKRLRLKDLAKIVMRFTIPSVILTKVAGI